MCPEGKDSLYVYPVSVLLFKAFKDLFIELEAGQVHHTVEPEELLFLVSP